MHLSFLTSALYVCIVVNYTVLRTLEDALLRGESTDFEGRELRRMPAGPVSKERSENSKKPFSRRENDPF